MLLDGRTGRRDKTGRVEEQKLLASDGAGSDWFGYSVAVSGDTAVIGARGDGPSSGSAYVFRYDPVSSSWVEEQKLLASDGAAVDYFGVSVAVSGDTAVIGAILDDDNGYNSGSAYVFDVASYADCNANGVPDECDIAGGTSQDCNGNGVPDECDIADVVSQDCDNNGIPDECEPPLLWSTRADFDDDGDVDVNDFLTFSTCFNGALNPPQPACETLCADLDFDNDVDANDFLTFSWCFNGALNPPRCP